MIWLDKFDMIMLLLLMFLLGVGLGVGFIYEQLIYRCGTGRNLRYVYNTAQLKVLGRMKPLLMKLMDIAYKAGKEDVSMKEYKADQKKLFDNFWV